MTLRDALAVAVALSCGCKRHEPAVRDQPSDRGAVAKPRAGDVIPHTTGPIKIDGEWHEPDWPQTALRGQFVGDDGQLARPSSELRLLHDDKDLIVALYAADDNIQSTDAFDLTVGKLALRFDATGKVTPATPGVRAAVDMDEGTIDNPKDNDEEWVVELAIPLAQTGLAPGAHVPIHAARCDTPKRQPQRCSSWAGSLTVE